MFFIFAILFHKNRIAYEIIQRFLVRWRYYTIFHWTGYFIDLFKISIISLFRKTFTLLIKNFGNRQEICCRNYKKILKDQLNIRTNLLKYNLTCYNTCWKRIYSLILIQYGNVVTALYYDIGTKERHCHTKGTPTIWNK